MPWQLRIDYPLIMGILNVTPDSFSDGGRYADVNAAVAHAHEMVLDGAHIIDMGAESSRPGSDPVPAKEQLRRLLPVLRKFRKAHSEPVSIDTWAADVAEACLAEGATTINDITALRGDKRMIDVVKKSKCDIVLMHMPGTPKSMQKRATYPNVMATLLRFFEQRIQACEDAGIDPKRLILDPGVGFGKLAKHNFTIIKNVYELKRFRLPVMIGVSRKQFLGTLTNLAVPAERDLPSVIAGIYALNKGADILRVHNVLAHIQAAVVMGAISRQPDAFGDPAEL